MPQLKIQSFPAQYDELASINKNFNGSLEEFIDDSLAAMVKNHTEVTIDLHAHFGSNNKIIADKSSLSYSDSSSGIDENRLPLLIALGGTSNPESESLNEHGFGLRIAIARLSAVKPTQNGSFIFKSKTKNGKGVQFTYFHPELVDYDYIDFNKPHGTTIIIPKCSDILYARQEDFTQITIPELESRYSKYIENGILKITFNLYDGDKLIKHYELKPCEPLWAHNDTQKKKLSGDNWSADVWWGDYPDDVECDEENLVMPKGINHPFSSSTQRRVAIYKNNILLCCMPYSGLGLQSYASNVLLTKSHCQVFLVKGFKTSLTKDYPQTDNNWNEFCEKFTELMTPVLKNATHKVGSFNEKEIQNEIVKRYKSFDRQYTEQYTVEGGGGKIDLVDRHIGNSWLIVELKNTDVDANDIYQVLRYVKQVKGEHFNRKLAKIIGPGITTYGKYTIEQVKDDFDVDIQFELLSKWI